MNFLHFKRKFIELYNQQKFEHFDQDMVNLVLTSKFEDVEAPTLLEAILLGTTEDIKAKTSLEIKSSLETFLGEIFSAEDLKFAFTSDPAELILSTAVNADPKPIKEIFTIPTTEFNASEVLDGFATNDLKFKSKYILNARLSETKDFTAANLVGKFKTTANLTFFTNWVDFEAEEIASQFRFNQPNMWSSVWYTIPGEVNLTAKFNDTVSMRSITEYYISHYEGTYLDEVSEMSLDSFVYKDA